MALYKDDYIRPALANGAHVSRAALEAATVTHPKGCPLVASSGYVAAATSEAVVDVVGISLDDGHNDTSAGSHSLGYIPVQHGVEFIGCVSGTIAQTQLFTDYGLKYDSTAEVWCVDLDEATAAQKCVQVVELIDAVGTVNGKVKFVFNEYGVATDGLK